MRRGKSFSLRTMGNFCEGATVRLLGFRACPRRLPRPGACSGMVRMVRGRCVRQQRGVDWLWRVGVMRVLVLQGVVLVLHRFPRALMVLWMRLAPCVPADR